MIDLGDDLAGYSDGDEPARPARPGQPTPTPAPGGGSTIPLADLQAAGFRTGVPAATGSFTDKIIRGSILLNHLLNDEPPHPPVLPFIPDDPDAATFGGVHVHTWLPGDEDDDSPPGPLPPLPPSVLRLLPNVGDEDDEHA